MYRVTRQAIEYALGSRRRDLKFHLENKASMESRLAETVERIAEVQRDIEQLEADLK